MRSQKGFALVELVIVLMVAGLLLGGAMMLIAPYLESAQRNATRERLNNIADSLAMYAQRYGRLPCPAATNPTVEPFGAPRNSGNEGTEWDNNCGGTNQADHIGIVPFRALGLTEENVRDGYGNLVTYAVAPVLAGSTQGNVDNVHEFCRQRHWIDGGNLNPRKARLCCARYLNANSELQVLDSRTGGELLFTGEHDTSGAVYGNVDVVATSQSFDTRFIAFILNSHGANGDRAPVQAPATPKPFTTVANAQERENSNGDFTFVAREHTRANDNDYFDDIILWRTNDQLVAAFGNDSCGKP